MRALVQLRGEINQSGAVEDTLEMLNLGRVNHATLVPETDTYEGMVTKVNDWIAHGEPSAATVATLLRERGEPAGSAAGSASEEADADADAGVGLTDDWVAEHTEYGDVDALAEALVAEETTLQDAGVAPTLRLHPPRGGHDGIKQPTGHGGQLGRHDPGAIDDLLEAMR